VIVDLDDYKVDLDGYDESDAESNDSVQREASKLSDSDFKKAAKSSEYDELVVVCGGSGSGKTEFAHTYYCDGNCMQECGNELDLEINPLVYVTTLSSSKSGDGISSKIKYAHKGGISKVRFILIAPKDHEKCYMAFLRRSRKIKPEVFHRSHQAAPSNFEEILDRDFKIKDTQFEIYLAEYVLETRVMTYNAVNRDSLPVIIKKAKEFSDISGRLC